MPAQRQKIMPRRISYILLVWACLCLPLAAATVADADALYKGGHWLKAADAYEKLLSANAVHGEERWRAMLRAGISREKSGNGKMAMHWADQIVRGAKGHSLDAVVGEAYLLKQRRVMAAKSSTAVRDKLVREASTRLNGHKAFSALCENEAVARAKEKRFDAARKLLSTKGVVLSPRGSNMVDVLEFSASRKNSGAVEVDKTAKAIFEINEKDHSLANCLVDNAAEVAQGDGRAMLLAKAAEIAAAASEDARAKKLYEDALAVKAGHVLRQRILMCYAGFLQTHGFHARCAEIYGEWRRAIRPDEKYDEPMRKCVAFLVSSHRYEEARRCVDRFCGDGSGVYSQSEKAAVLKRISAGLDGGMDDGRSVEAWNAMSSADTLFGQGKFGDAAKSCRAIAANYGGRIGETARKRLGECYCRMGKFDMAAQVWDELAKGGGDLLKYDCLARKAKMLLLDKRDVAAAKEVYLSMRTLIDGNAACLGWRLRELEVSMAMCNLAEGRVEDAEPVFVRERDAAASARSLDIAKWMTLVDACATAKAFAVVRSAALKDAVIADLLAASERHAEAEALCRDAMKKPGLPRSLLAYVMMQRAKCLVHVKKFKDALEVYKAIQMKFSDCPCAARAMLRAGVLCAGHLGDPMAGCGFFKFIEEKWPKSPLAEQALFYRLTIAIWLQRWREAEELSARFAATYPDSPRLPIVMGEYAELIVRRIRYLPEQGG